MLGNLHLTQWRTRIGLLEATAAVGRAVTRSSALHSRQVAAGESPVRALSVKSGSLVETLHRSSLLFPVPAPEASTYGSSEVPNLNDIIV